MSMAATLQPQILRMIFRMKGLVLFLQSFSFFNALIDWITVQ
jgi:hypothetical protein